VNRYDPQEMFGKLCHHLQVQPDRRGECYVTCPFCGKESSAKDAHFSFSERGGHCFVCGKSGGLYGLLRVYGLTEGAAARKLGSTSRADPAPTPPPRPAAKRAATKVDWEAMVRRYESHPETVSRWSAYKPLPEDLIRAYRLGYGIFPQYTSHCQHPRLMVPLIENGVVVGLRGRKVDCGCGDTETKRGDKWLSPAGTRCILFNGERFGQGPGMGFAYGQRRADRYTLLLIVENPIDALLAEVWNEDVVAVATLGVSMWKAEWTPFLVRVQPAAVVVFFDNDRPGNGGGQMGRKDWLATHPTDIEPNGIRLVHHLQAAGIRGACLGSHEFRRKVRPDWPGWEGVGLHSDLGDLLVPEVRKRLAL